MSDVFYPLGLIARLDVEHLDRTVVDEFESGAASSRRGWSAGYFKRRFALTHSALTPAEFERLRAFQVARSGRYDAFWFRDNVHRGGNATVRFGQVMRMNRDGVIYRPELLLEEVAPIRALPGLEEMTTAAGTAPSFWFDVNRQTAYLHAGTYYGDGGIIGSAGCAVYDTAGSLALGEFTIGSNNVVTAASLLSQWQYMNGVGRSTNDVDLGAADLAITVLLITKNKTSSTKQVLFSTGSAEEGRSVGIALDDSNKYVPFLYPGAGWQTWTGVTNSSEAWRSVASVWASGSNAATLYVNGTSTAAGTNTRNYSAGKVAIGCAPDGLHPVVAADTSLAHALIFLAALSQAQVKAVHNLLAHQYGMALV